jgi:hypothetical protein
LEDSLVREEMTSSFNRMEGHLTLGILEIKIKQMILEMKNYKGSLLMVIMVLQLKDREDRIKEDRIREQRIREDRIRVDRTREDRIKVD